MKIVVLVKYVPDATANRSFSDSDLTTDRVGVDGVLSELDEHALEAALTIADGEGEVVALTMGPDDAGAAVKKALQMGADSGVHVSDEALHGSDAPATSRVLAAALDKVAEQGDRKRVGQGKRAEVGGV